MHKFYYYLLAVEKVFWKKQILKYLIAYLITIGTYIPVVVSILALVEDLVNM